MKCMQVPLGEEGAYLETYFLEESPEMCNSHSHTAVLICPGGAYAICSDREAEPVAMAFCARGFSAAVLRYPVCPHRFPTQLKAAARAMAWMKEHGKEFALDPEKIAVAGFSAGGHLAASLGVFWNAPFLQKETGLQKESMRPWKMILGYPVITSGEFSHAYSFRCLLGEDFGNRDKMELVSLEKQVTRDTPATFLWNTVTDPAVPAENTLLFAMALRKARVPFELHMYSQGNHGLSLANAVTVNAQGDGLEPCCEGWLPMAADWLRR